jgi:hypothetical protein
MTATVQASCPGCRNILRIPVDWADRALRCKKCGTVVQAKKRDREPGTPAPSPIPASDTAPAPAVGSTAPAAPGPASPEFAPPIQPAPPDVVPQAYNPYAPPPGYPYPPQPGAYNPYPAPGYPYAVPPGYPYPPQAFGYPPQPGYPPPGYSYPAPQAPGFTEHLATDDGELPEASHSRRKYNRHRGGERLVSISILLVIGIALAGGSWMVYQKHFAKPDGRGTNPSASAPNEKHAGPVETAAKTVNTLAKAGDPFPRRMLFIHIANYIYFNNLSAGSSGGQDMPTKSATKLAYELRVPTDKDNNQLFVLSDTAGGKDFHPPVKSVVMPTYEQFFQTCREQDRIVVYFGGHAVAADGKTYLVPVEGEPDNPATYIPLDDFYARLRDCKAQQKVVLFDVCRLDPARGEEKPGSDKMSEELAKLLLAAPPGVRVGLSCSPGENAQEDHDTGSEFLTAFRVVAEMLKREGKSTPQKPDDPLPVANFWLDGIKSQLARQPGKLGPQTVRVGGSDAPAQVAYNKDESPAKRFDWPASPKGVAGDEVVRILQQVNLPGIRSDLSVPADLPRVYPFAEDVMKSYMPDGVSEKDIRESDNYPVRKAALDAIAKITAVWKIGGDGVGIMEEFTGEVDDKLKKDIQNQQVVPAKIILSLEEAAAELDEAGKDLDKEKSKRWRAIFQYARAQTLLRLTFMHEYDGALGKIRTDSLPKDPNGMRTGLRLVSTPKTNPKNKEKVEEAKDLLEKIAEEHKGTPYEVIAKLHKHISVGLEWRAVSKAKAEDDAK